MARNTTTWQPGHCPNPGGRPKIAREIRDLAKMDAKDAYAKVKRIAMDDEHRQQLAAALAILKAAGVALSEDKTPEADKPPAQPSREMTVEDLEQAAAGGQA